MLGEVSSVYK